MADRAQGRDRPKLVAFATMLEGQKIETVELAYETAVELSADALDPMAALGRDCAEPLHDALSRFAALLAAGNLRKIA